MRWKGRRQSTNVEDRRGRRVPVKLGGGAILVIALVAILLGEDPVKVVDILGDQVGSSTASVPSGGGSSAPSAAEDELAEFAAVVLADTEAAWSRLLAENGLAYEPPTLVLFTDAVDSGCGRAPAAVGPFYCGADRKIYVDLAFYRELRDRFGAPGDFARAYVIAHEVGHHLQKLLGISDQLQTQKRRLREVDRNLLSVKQELQADCFAGVWGHHADQDRQLLEAGDLEEGLNAAAAIGDDTLQRRAGASVDAESWTHGSSEQRVRWFQKGFDSGRIDACNTYRGVER